MANCAFCFCEEGKFCFPTLQFVVFTSYFYHVAFILKVAATADKQIHVYDLNSGNKVCFGLIYLSI